MSKPKIEKSERVEAREEEQMLTAWEAAVRATHFFLSDEDIRKLRPEVRAGLRHIDLLYCARDDENVVKGFMGVAERKIEMLFIHPDQRGMGWGREFIAFALDKLGVRYVDVNEQNTQAVGFYEHMGFRTFNRSAFDAQGNAFPILHMKTKNGSSLWAFVKTGWDRLKSCLSRSHG